jgi:4-hydroxy-2-oxoheptanedioate aldolase
VTPVNPIHARWVAGETAFGTMCALGSPVSAGLAAEAGFDFVCIDLQHGLLGFGEAVTVIEAVQARGAAPVVRVPVGEYGLSLIERVLDAGALGVIVPMVNSRADAERAVAACRYPPLGARSFGPVRASVMMASSDPADLEQVICAVQVETAAGLEHCEEIASAAGVDAIVLGPADLGISQGLGADVYRHVEDPSQVSALRAITQACHRNAIAVGTACTSAESARRYAEGGFSMVLVSGDVATLTAGFRANLDQARGASTGRAPAGTR